MLDLALTIDARAVREARHALDRFQREIAPAAFHDLKLLVSELVTNSIRHGRLSPQDSLSLLIDVKRERVRVEVADCGVGFDARRPTPSLIGGWGLLLVSRISNRWGVERRPDETRVWFEIDQG